MRLLHWERLLAAELDKARKQAFAWGTFDCALFACDGVNAMTGIDPGAAFRGKYSTEAEAKSIFGADLGYFAAGICAQNNWPEWTAAGKPAPLFARRGDVVLVNNGANEALGVIDHTGKFALCATFTGLARQRQARWLRAWKIG